MRTDPYDGYDEEGEWYMTHCRVCRRKKDKGESYCGDRECIYVDDDETETEGE